MIDIKIEKIMFFDGKKKVVMVFKEKGLGNRDKVISSYSFVV